MVSDEREFRDFDEVELKGIGHLLLTQGSADAVRVEANDAETLARVETTQRGSRLILDYKPGLLARTRVPRLAYHVTFRTLGRLIVSGAAKAEAGALQTDALRIDLSGAGAIDIERLTATRLEIDVSGSGAVRLGGAVERQRVRMSGAGRHHAEALHCADAEISISGAGTAELRAENTLMVNLSGVGSVDYHGNPRVEQRVTGIGRVRRAPESGRHDG